MFLSYIIMWQSIITTTEMVRKMYTIYMNINTHNVYRIYNYMYVHT